MNNKLIIGILILGFLTVKSLGDKILTPDVLVFVLPMFAILSFSPIGKALADAIRGKEGSGNSELSNKVSLLEKTVREQEEELSKIREAIVFEDKKLLNSKNEIDLNKK